MITVNDWIATVPFPETNIKTSVTRGVALIQQTLKLTKLEVVKKAVLNDGNILNRGNFIFVKGDAMKHQWATDILEDEDGIKYILIPKNILVGFEINTD